jgi:2-amino-4-hydroxy-6-hydroxymethyldihydropteridine diphosphokinase
MPKQPAKEGVIAFIGIGSNMGDAAARCREAMDRLGRIKGSALLSRSSLYRTEPVGFKDQDWFVNAVVELRTGLSARDLLNLLKAVERDMGRKEDEVRWGPRVIDLDILLMGQDVIAEEDLVVPHPELHKRRFALQPLAELAPYAIHPAFGISVKGLMDRLADESAVELIR